jgi:hypothetical protein
VVNVVAPQIVSQVLEFLELGKVCFFCFNEFLHVFCEMNPSVFKEAFNDWIAENIRASLKADIRLLRHGNWL